MHCISEVPNDDDLWCTECNLDNSKDIPRGARETKTSARDIQDCSNYYDYYLHWADHLDSINKTRKAPTMGKLDQTRTTAEDQNTQTKSTSRNEIEISTQTNSDEPLRKRKQLINTPQTISVLMSF